MVRETTRSIENRTMNISMTVELNERDNIQNLTQK